MYCMQCFCVYKRRKHNVFSLENGIYVLQMPDMKEGLCEGLLSILPVYESKPIQQS